jgi:hypothetical protein
MNEGFQIARVSFYLLKIEGEGDKLVNDKHGVMGLPIPRLNDSGC